MLHQCLNKELLENKKCLVVCPSRNRVEKMKEMLESFRKTTSPFTELLVMLDDDDKCLEEYKELFGTKVAYHVGKKTTNTHLFNSAFSMFPDYEYYCLTNDDFVYLTAVWDAKLMSNIKELGGWGISYGDDRIVGDQYPSHTMVSGNIVRALGWLQLPSLKHLCGDWVWGNIGAGIGRIKYDNNVIIKHNHPFDKKTAPDEIFNITNSQQMYAVDQDSYKRWMKTQVKKDISKILREIFKEKEFNKTVCLCMIIGQNENIKDIKQCIDSVKDWIDELSININYKQFPNIIKINAIKSLIKSYGFNHKISCNKFNNFSNARNITLKQAKSDYILILDCDDVMPAPWSVKDMLCKYPAIDVFHCHVISSNVVHKEHITQPRLFKNLDYMEYRNNVHEDVSFSFQENKAHTIRTDIIVMHLGNTNRKRVSKKNLRNYELTLKEINSPQAHSLTYFAIVNELMLMKKYEKNVEAIKWIDKYFDKFPDNGKDPLVPKMWILRGACSLDCNQVEAAITNFAKAWHGWEHPEAAVMLGTCHMKNQDWDKAINILEEINKKEKFMVCNIPIDMESIELVLLENLGLAYYYKAQSIIALKKTSPHMYNENAHKIVLNCFNKAEEYLMKYLQFDEMNLTVADKLAEVYREQGKMNDANSVTVSLINMHKGYWQGWNNMAQFEAMNKRYRTAELFFEKAYKLNPKNKETEHNLRMVRKMK